MVAIKLTTVATQTFKVDLATFNMSDEDIMNQITTTHSAPGAVAIDVKPVLDVAENILKHATHIVDCIATGAPVNMVSLEVNTPQDGFTAPSTVLENITREMGCKALHGENAHKVALSLLDMLSSYSWDAKAVMVLAAFAVNYGEFWLLTQHTSDQLAKSVAMLKRVPDILNPSVSLKLGLFSMNNLVKAVLSGARSIVLIEKLATEPSVKDLPALKAAKASVPVYVYWLIMTVVYCASQINSLTSVGEVYQTPELFNFSNILTNINALLGNQLEEIEGQQQTRKGEKVIIRKHWF